MAAPRINNGSSAPPSLRFDFNLICGSGLPPSSVGPRVSPLGVEEGGYEALRRRGYGGVQQALLLNPDRKACDSVALRRTASALVVDHRRLLKKAKRWRDEGFDAATVLLGDGLEDLHAALPLAEAVLGAQAKTGLPLFIETHRGTITQDIAVTRGLIEKLPELRFNADLSHYVTGHLLGRPGAARQLDALAPILDRVRFIHGRLSDDFGAQVHRAPGLGTPAPAEWPLFRELWVRCMTGFLRDAGPGDVLVFAPELLPIITGYAEVEVVDGALREVGDRSRVADALCAAASRCFEEAHARVASDRGDKSWADLEGRWALAPKLITPDAGTVIVRALTHGQLRDALRDESVRDAEVVRLRLGTGTETMAEMRGWAREVIAAQATRRAPLLCETTRGTFLRHIPTAAALARAVPELRFALDPAGWYLSHEFFPNQLPTARKAMAPVVAATELLVVGHAGASRTGRFTSGRTLGVAEIMDGIGSRFLRRVFKTVAKNGHDVRWVPSETLHPDDGDTIARWLEARGVSRVVG